MQVYIKCGSAWMSVTRSSIRKWRWIYAWAKWNNFVDFLAQLACWRRNCQSHNDREASWDDVCEVLLSFQANWLNLENIPSWWWAKVVSVFYCAAHKSDQPIHKVSQSDASPAWLPPAGCWQLWKRRGHSRSGGWHWQGASGKLLLAPPEFSLPRERQVFTPQES